MSNISTIHSAVQQKNTLLTDEVENFLKTWLAVHSMMAVLLRYKIKKMNPNSAERIRPAVSEVCATHT